LPNGFGWFQLNGYGSLHEQIAGHMVYMGFCGTMVKVERDARDHLSHCLVPEVPQGAPPGRSEEPENRDKVNSRVSGLGSQGAGSDGRPCASLHRSTPDGISCRDRKGSERDRRESIVRRASNPADNVPAGASMEPELLRWDGGACVCGSDSEVCQVSEVAEGRATCFLPPMNRGVSAGRIS
jgi:hypothetical protein